MASLLHFCAKWYLFFSVILFITLTIVGLFFFSQFGGHDDIVWRLPWLLLAFGTALNLLLAPILAFLEGLGKVQEVAQLRLWQQIVGLLIVWGGLITGAKLYVLGVNWLIGIILVAVFILKSDFRYILQIYGKYL
ncbi:hypothetical protein ACIXPB_19915 [Bacteroides fragilis]